MAEATIEDLPFPLFFEGIWRSEGGVGLSTTLLED